MTFKESDLIIRRFANDYNKSKIIEKKGLELLNDEQVREEYATYMDSKKKYLYYCSLQGKIDLILEKLDWDDSFFIKREFFSDNYKKNWWINYYSRSTYYRLKKRAMENFLGLLYV